MSCNKTTCKEVCSTCKCTVTEKPVCCKKDDGCKKDCVATIVGVLSLPESFCQSKDPCDQNDCCPPPCCPPPCCPPPCCPPPCCPPPKDECVDVYRDLGECIQKAIVKTSKTC